jgi:hypothetical protein
MRSIVKAVIRIILIFLFLESLLVIIRYGGTIWSAGLDSPDWYFYRYLLILVAVEAIIILFIWVLWWKTGWIVRRFIGETSDDSLVISTSNLNLFIVAIRILGIFLIINALSDIIGNIVYYYTYDKMVPDVVKPELTTTLIRGLSTSGATLIFGLILAFVGTKVFNPLVNLWSTGSLSGKTPDSEDS